MRPPIWRGVFFFLQTTKIFTTMKRIYEQFNCDFNSAHLAAKIIAKSGEDENAVELLPENILRATLERPNVSGAEQIEYNEDEDDTRASAFDIHKEYDFSILDVWLRNLTLGMNRVVFVIQYGTNAKIKLVYDINVTALEDDMQGFELEDIAISEQAAVEKTTIDGESGEISLGDGLQMVGKQLSVKGGSSVEIFDLGTLTSEIPSSGDISNLVSAAKQNELKLKLQDYMSNDNIAGLVNLVLKCKDTSGNTVVMTYGGRYYKAFQGGIEEFDLTFLSMSGNTIAVYYSYSLY